MVNRSKQKGTSWETSIVGYLRDELGDSRIERRTLSGALDKGDIAGVPDTAVEAKDVAKIELAAFLDEAKVEARNAKVPVGVAWIKRRGKASPGDAYVVMDGATFTYLLREAMYG